MNRKVKRMEKIMNGIGAIIFVIIDLIISFSPILLFALIFISDFLIPINKFLVKEYGELASVLFTFSFTWLIGVLVRKIPLAFEIDQEIVKHISDLKKELGVKR